MSSTKYAKTVDEIQRLLKPDLQRLGFRKQARTYNRSEEPGVVQVINFQMGLGSFSGKFTVNVGVAVSEVYESVQQQPFPAFVKEYSCIRRKRLGQLVDGKDRWWDLQGSWWKPSESTNSIAQEIKTLFIENAIPYLERFSTRSKIIDQCVMNANRSTGTDTDMDYEGRSKLDVVIMLAAADRKQEAGSLLAEYYHAGDHNDSHKQYVRDLAKELKLDSFIKAE